MMAAFTSGEHFMPPVDTKWKPHLEVAPNCPRCASSNTKFCYYNNYSLSQPRYFCKACRRYWTKGGSLRNVPVGGGCRKSRRSSKASRSSAFRAPPAPGSGHGGGGCSGESSSSSSTAAAGSGSDIDMAVVFAKFLNPGPAPPEGVEVGSNSNSNSNSNSLSDSISSTPESGMMIGGDMDGILFSPTVAAGGSSEFFDLFREDGFLDAAGIGGGDDHHHQEEELNNQESMIHALGMQTLLSDEMAQLEAALWSTGNETLPETTAAAWEPPQEFDAGDFGMPPATNNWGCYDLQQQQLQGSFDILLPQSLAKPSTNY